MSSSSAIRQRVQVSATINGIAPGLKTFLFDFLTKAKVFAKITHDATGTTSIIAQGHPQQFPQTFNVLKDLIFHLYEDSAIVWDDAVPVSEDDFLPAVTIEDTAPALRRDASSGEFRERQLEEISFGGSASTENVKKIIQNAFTSLSPFGRVTGVLRGEEKHISIKYQQSRFKLEVSTLQTLIALHNAIDAKFKLAVPIDYIYKWEDGDVVKITDIQDLESGSVYYIKTKNDTDPISIPISPQSYAPISPEVSFVSMAPGYIKPDLQDFLLTDITAKELRVIAEAMEVDYLGSASFPGSFPATGRIWVPNHRLMVSLVCRRQSNKEAPARNIIFLIDTGSPSTYLCQEAMEALIGKDSHIPQTLFVKIHGEEVILAHLSPKGSHFADVNVLGMDFLAQNRVFPIPDWVNRTFILQ